MATEKAISKILTPKLAKELELLDLSWVDIQSEDVFPAGLVSDSMIENQRGKVRRHHPALS